MAILAPFMDSATSRAWRHEPVPDAVYLRVDSQLYTHALVALAAKLAAVDGVPVKAEYMAFHALFVDGDGADALHHRSLFMKRVADASPALQYARQIASACRDRSQLRDILSRLLQIAVADAPLNAAELELLRAVADIFAMDREMFRALVAGVIAPITGSPYAVIGVKPDVTDSVLRARYLARVQMLHPDRYQAAGASAETVAMLSEQVAAVNAAYSEIRAQRAKKRGLGDGLSSWWSRRNTKGAEAAMA